MYKRKLEADREKSVAEAEDGKRTEKSKLKERKATKRVSKKLSSRTLIKGVEGPAGEESEQDDSSLSEKGSRKNKRKTEKMEKTDKGTKNSSGNSTEVEISEEYSEKESEISDCTEFSSDESDNEDKEVKRDLSSKVDREKAVSSFTPTSPGWQRGSWQHTRASSSDFLLRKQTRARTVLLSPNRGDGVDEEGNLNVYILLSLVVWFSRLRVIFECFH